MHTKENWFFFLPHGVEPLFIATRRSGNTMLTTFEEFTLYYGSTGYKLIYILSRYWTILVCC